MSDVTEQETLDRLRTSFRSCADLCRKLATEPAQGPNYRKIMDELKLVEGCARALGSLFRDDARWLQIGLHAQHVHDVIGRALRQHYPRKFYLKITEGICALHGVAEQLATSRTERVGQILPKPLEGPHRETRPVQVSTSGLVLPPRTLIVPSTVH